MEIVWAIVAVVGAIMILVFVHEMGHFLAAKLFKMRIDRFSVGFPPKILGKKIGQTEYVLGATPLGGYVKIAGMVDESMDTKFAESEPQPWEFRAKPVWQRVIVITAGVAFNIILAAVIFAGLKFAYGDTRPAALADGSIYVADSSAAAQLIGLQTGDRILSIGGESFDPEESGASMIPLLADELTFVVERGDRQVTLEGPEDIMTQIQDAGEGGLFGLGIYNWPSIIGAVEKGSPADSAGLKSGHRIRSIDGRPVKYWMEMTESIKASEGRPLMMEWEPANATSARPLGGAVTATLGDDGQYRIGVQLQNRRVHYSVPKAVGAGILATWQNTRAITINLKRIFSGREDLRKNLGGPVMVAKITGRAARNGGEQFWTIVALLSITLAIVNILPVPALDGGHLMFLIYEGIVGREPPLKVRMATQQIGMVLLFALMAFLVYNDITRL